MEMELRKHLHTENVSETAEVKTIAVQRIMDNEDVQLHWAMISINWVEYKMVLLKMIINHWVTVRGFSFAGAFMEIYKQKHKKTTQKSKGLRKTLSTTKEVSSETSV